MGSLGTTETLRVSRHVFFFILCTSISHIKSRLSLIVRVNVVLNRTVVVDSD